MRYLVVLHCESAVGAIYGDANNDGYVRAGQLRHPMLDCSALVTNSANYLFLTRDTTKQGKSQQFVYVPHSSVVYIHCYADEGTKPIGFI